MNDPYTFAKFLRDRREAMGMNPREFADAITSAGGKASTQAVQQWERTDPGQRTTRPAHINRFAIAMVLKCEPQAVEEAYNAAHGAAKVVPGEASSSPSRLKKAGSLLASSRSGKGDPFAPIDRAIKLALVEEVPDADLYLDKVITPFGVRREYNYLSPKLAAVWLMSCSDAPYFDEDVLASWLWRLLWLSRLDADTGVPRKYLLILYLIGHDAAAVPHVMALVERLKQETCVFGNFLTIQFTSSPESAAEKIADAESGSAGLSLALPANATPG